MLKITNDVQLNPVWHGTSYGCTHMATVGTKEPRSPSRTVSWHLGDFLLDPSFKQAYSFEPKLNLNAKIRQYTNTEIKFGL